MFSGDLQRILLVSELNLFSTIYDVRIVQYGGKNEKKAFTGPVGGIRTRVAADGLEDWSGHGCRGTQTHTHTPAGGIHNGDERFKKTGE